MRRAVVAVLATALLPGVAGAAYYGRGATVVSASLQREELADDRSVSVDLARDGRFVVFDTRATNFFADDDPDPPFDDGTGNEVPTDRQGGIFRRDLDTGALELVAIGDLVDERDARRLLVRGARNPSVSADGRYVAFSTAQRLVPADRETPQRFVDVYVRDMSVPICTPLPGCTPNPYTLVSALDRTDVPITYATGTEPTPGGEDGAELYPATSISSDGRRVVFRTTEHESDAPGAPDSVPGTPSTPPLQLLFRDIPSKRTHLVTRTRPDAPEPNRPAGSAFGPLGISGDGTTVAWTGGNARQQTRFQPGEASDPRLAFYLYKRFEGDDLSGGPTRRITGMTDPDDPACPSDGAVELTDERTAGPCYGPLAQWEEGRGSIAARNVSLSEDGYTVAFTTQVGVRGVTTTSTEFDVFTTSMRPGATRKSSTRELTREGIGDPAAAAGIEGAALSPDAGVLALVTKRTRFLLPALQLVGTVRPNPTVRDLYLADLASGRTERALVGLGGADPNDAVDTAVSLSSGAARVAFVSQASNLFRGDANAQADAFVVREQPLPVDVEPPGEPPPPPGEVATGEIIPDAPVLAVRVLRGAKTGEMIIEVRPPDAGRVGVEARGRLPDRDGRRRASAPIKTLARAAKQATKPRERVRLTLRLGRSERSLLRRLRRLSTSATATWTPRAAALKALRRTVTVRFQVIASKKRQVKNR